MLRCRRQKDTLRLVQALRSGILGADDDVPFELRVLEALLSETVNQFERHLRRLLLLSEMVEREVTSVLKSSTGDLTRLLPIQKWVTRTMHSNMSILSKAGSLEANPIGNSGQCDKGSTDKPSLHHPLFMRCSAPRGTVLNALQAVSPSCAAGRTLLGSASFRRFGPRSMQCKAEFARYCWMLQLACRRLTEMRQDINETKETIKHVLDSEELAGLCLTEREKGVLPSDIPRNSESVREAALLLQSYERQISTLENALKVIGWVCISLQCAYPCI